MTATASPTWRTLSCASNGCCGLMNLCWTSAVHLLGSESCVSGAGGRVFGGAGPAQGGGGGGRGTPLLGMPGGEARGGRGAPHEAGVRHGGKMERGDEFPAPGKQPPILAARQRPADKGGVVGVA